MRHQHVLQLPPIGEVDPATVGSVRAASLFGEPVRGRALLAVGDHWAEELLATLPIAERHDGDAHFAPTAAGPGLRPCSMGLLVVDPAVARVEALRPVLVRGGALAVVDADGTVRWARDACAPRVIGRLRGGRR